MLNQDTIINGKFVKLNKTEQNGVERFHRSRIAFAVIEKENDFELAMNINDPREHRVYLREDFNIDDETFEKLIRGYIKPGKINLYVSSHFYKVPNDKITDELIRSLLQVALTEYGEGEYVIGNGVEVGKPGEEWEPIDIIDKVNITERKLVKVYKC